jgi:hypothetical protein
LFKDAEADTTNSSTTQGQWNVTEASRVLHYMEHICEPRADLSATFPSFAHDSLFGTTQYNRHLDGRNITDNTTDNLQDRKLLSFLRNVIIFMTIQYAMH